MQERQVAATVKCDGDHFKEVNTCMSSILSMYVVVITWINGVRLPILLVVS